METHAFGFRLRANAPEGQKRFPISPRYALDGRRVRRDLRPAAAILRVNDVEEALQVANGLDYGLGAALWTSDLQRASKLARRIEAGSVFINGMVASDPRLPFGGIKQSGYGRELRVHGAREFTNVKTVWVGPAR